MGKKLKMYQYTHKTETHTTSGLVLARGKKQAISMVEEQFGGAPNKVATLKIPKKEGIVDTFSNMKSHAN